MAAPFGCWPLPCAPPSTPTPAPFPLPPPPEAGAGAPHIPTAPPYAPAPVLVLPISPRRSPLYAACRLPPSPPFHPMRPCHAAMEGPSTALQSLSCAPHRIPFLSAIPPAPAFLPTAATLHDVPEKSQGGSLPPQFYLVPFLAPLLSHPPTAAQANSSCVHCPAAILLPAPRPSANFSWLRSNRHPHFMCPLFPVSKSELGSVCVCVCQSRIRTRIEITATPSLCTGAQLFYVCVCVWCGATSLHTATPSCKEQHT